MNITIKITRILRIFLSQLLYITYINLKRSLNSKIWGLGPIYDDFWIIEVCVLFILEAISGQWQAFLECTHSNLSSTPQPSILGPFPPMFADFSEHFTFYYRFTVRLSSFWYHIFPRDRQPTGKTRMRTNYELIWNTIDDNLYIQYSQ